MRTIEKHILEDFTTIPTPEADKVVVGFDLDGLFKCKDENGVVRSLEGSVLNYKSLTGLLSIPEPIEKTNGLLVIGKHYLIDTFRTDDDFSNIANIIRGTINTDSCIFIATGTTPNNWSNGTLLIEDGTPIINILSNTLGDITIELAYSPGGYLLTSTDLFTDNKTLVLIPSLNNGNDINIIFHSIRNSSSNIIINSYSSTDGGTKIPATISPIDCCPIEIRVYN